jgi:magnesium-transporting ATPase (P-type)
VFQTLGSQCLLLHPAVCVTTHPPPTPPGDKIIADGLVLESHGLVIDEASLTGESDPIKKNEEDPWCRSGTQVLAVSGVWDLGLMLGLEFRGRVLGYGSKFQVLSCATTVVQCTSSPTKQHTPAAFHTCTRLCPVTCCAMAPVTAHRSARALARSWLLLLVTTVSGARPSAW